MRCRPGDLLFYGEHSFRFIISTERSTYIAVSRDRLDRDSDGYFHALRVYEDSGMLSAEPDKILVRVGEKDLQTVQF